MVDFLLLKISKIFVFVQVLYPGRDRSTSGPVETSTTAVTPPSGTYGLTVVP